MTVERRYALIGHTHPGGGDPGLITRLDDVEADLVAETAARITGDNDLQAAISALAEGSTALTFLQPEAPVPGVGGVPDPIPEGARWFDTDDSNRPYIYFDGSWVDISDPRIGDNQSSITALVARMDVAEDDIDANAIAIDVLDTSVFEIEGALTAQASQLTALSSTVNNPTSGVTANAAAITNLTTRVTNTETVNTGQATSITALQTAVNNPTTGLLANASATAALGVRVTSAEGTISSQGSSITALQSTVNNPTTGVAATATGLNTLKTRVDTVGGGIEAIATDLSSVETTLYDPSTGLSATRATVTTQGTSINGIQAKYTVKIDNNGSISGYGLVSEPNNGSIVSTFNVLADNFKVTTPGGEGYTPFSISGGVVYADNLVVQNANIANLSVGKLTTGTLGATVTQNGDWLVGTGKIIFDNGVFLKAQGIGFGSSNQFIEWFGPRPTGGNLALCTEANAISYLKTNGSAYFGGTLSAGIIKNSAQTTDTSASAEILIGPFTTNGNTKNILVSYSYEDIFRCDANTGAITGAAASVSVVVEKSINGAAWVALGTLVAPETERLVVVDGDPFVDDLVRLKVGGSTTYTDNSGATTNMRLRARITVRSLPALSGTGINDRLTTQNITIVSTEG